MVAWRQEEPDEETWLTTREAAAIAGVERKLIGSWCYKGHLSVTLATCPANGQPRYMIAMSSLRTFVAWREEQEDRRQQTQGTWRQAQEARRQRVAARRAEEAARRAEEAAKDKAEKRRARARAVAVLNTVLQVYKIRRADLEGKGRALMLVEARRVAIWLLREDAGLGVTDIGRWLLRDHSTVIHHLDRYTRWPTHEETWAVGEVRRLLAGGRP